MLLRAWITVVTLACASALSGATVTGTVNDGGVIVKDGKLIHPPIEGVDVTAFDAAGKRVGVTVLTGPEGKYELPDIPANTIISIQFEKIHYLDKPTTRLNIAVSSKLTEVDPTFLALRNGTDEYYKSFAIALMVSPDSTELRRLFEHLGSKEQSAVEAHKINIRRASREEAAKREKRQ